jgi:hypothetical protein
MPLHSQEISRHSEGGIAPRPNLESQPQSIGAMAILDSSPSELMCGTWLGQPETTPHHAKGVGSLLTSQNLKLSTGDPI